MLVDECRWKFRGRLWCHLISDRSYDELHSFARQLGMPRIAFQGDHYDLHETNRARAIALGAVPVDSTHIVRALRVSGLRRGPALIRSGIAGVQHLPAPTLTTDRLLLRQWRPSDVNTMVAVAQDPEVTKWLGGPRSAESMRAGIDRDSVGLATRGLGKWAVTDRSTGEFIGRVGLSGAFDVPISPAVEIGWTLRPSHWGKGLATEAAQAALAYGFEELDLREIYAFTHRRNEPSRAVMRRLGMTYDPTLDYRVPTTTYELDNDCTVFYRLTSHVTQPPA
jgi:RimJ/RimL family protein N-acetyltransferase